jgi:pimeloyl-ACP methyl ester carboxylesterase
MSATGTVTAADSTAIAWRSRGDGAPLVFVHGGLGDVTSWDLVFDLLEPGYELVSYDRRGRGASGWGSEPHGLVQEVADARRVVDLAGAGATLMGHSYGAVVALELARTSPDRAIDRLVLYEPPVPVDGLNDSAAVVACRRLMDRGAHEDALLLALERVVRLRPDEIEGARTSPDWQRLVDRAPSLAREVEAVDALGGDVERYRTIDVPTLLVVGDASPPMLTAAVAQLADVMPRAEVATLHGEGHLAHVTNPPLLANALAAFLRATA